MCKMEPNRKIGATEEAGKQGFLSKEKSHFWFYVFEKKNRYTVYHCLGRIGGMGDTFQEPRVVKIVGLS